MQLDNQQWRLFGYDLTRLGRFVRAGWQELLRGQQAGIRKRLEAPVELRTLDGTRYYYVAEQALSSEQLAEQPAFQALQLPPDLVLLKVLSLPGALELELDEAMALEVHSSSPFPQENTCYGWTVVSRQDDSLQVSLAIAARDDVTQFLQQQGIDALNGQEVPEVWVMDTQQSPVVLRGFGEGRRYRAYSRRVASVGARLAALLLLLIMIAAVPPLVRDLQAGRMQAYLQEVEAESAEAQALRTELVQGNERIRALQEVLNEKVDYHQALDHLARVTQDGIYLQRLEAQGRQLRLSGWAENAASYMQLLTNDSAYSSVSAPSAFSLNSRTGLERFVLDVQLDSGDRE